MPAFSSLARKHFGFMSTDFPFRLTSDAEPVRYDSSTLYVELWSGNGEVDLIFGVKVDTDILRPYVSHLFSIAEIVRYYKEGPFPTFKSFSGFPDLTEEERYLIHLASLTRRYCADILNGDLSVLERLSTNRGAKRV